MASFLRLLVLSLLFSLTLPAAANEKFGKAELDAQKELLQLKIDSSRELTQKDVDSLKSRIDALDKRLDDQNNRVGDIGQAIDRLAVTMGDGGILLTVLLALGGLVGYFSVARQAKEEAKATSQQWFDSNHAKLLAQIEALQQAATQAQQTIAHKVDAVTQLHDVAITHIQGGMGKTGENGTPINSEEEAALRQSAEEIKAKPEASYSFEDWNTRAFDAFQAKQYEDAALYWKHASNVPNAGVANTVQALFNRAVSFHHLTNYTESCNTYRQLIDSYSSDNTPSIRELVAKAMRNMGGTLEKMACPDKAIAILQQMIATYSSDTDPTVREQVAKAFNSKGFALLLEAKKTWENRERAVSLLHDALNDLFAGLERRPDCGMTRGNLAYVQWLLGEAQAAENSFSSALAVPQDSGEALYHGTVADIEQHTIAEDQGFREMVERLWAEHQAVKSSGD